jgi:cell division protein FtsW (lipid II flippase)
MNPASTPRTSSIKSWCVPALVAALALAVGHALRFFLVEPTDMAQGCDAAPWSSIACAVRTITVWAFAQQGLGWTALGLAAWACVLAAKGIAPRWHAALALAALTLGCLGLALYNADASAWAVTLAVMARAWQQHRARWPKPEPNKRL